MIGDNENDAAAARAAGLPLVLMRYGYARVDPASLAADALLDHFSEIARRARTARPHGNVMSRASLDRLRAPV